MEENILSNKIRVVHFLRNGGYSGAENVVIQIIKGTSEICDSIYASPAGDISNYLAVEGIEQCVLNSVSPIEIKRAIKKTKPDVIHAHDYYMSLLVGLVEKKIPIISHLHNNALWIKKVNFKTIGYRFVSSHFTKVLCVSHSILDEYVFSNAFRDRSQVVGNPVNIRQIKEKADIVEGEEKCYEISYLGRLTQPKNPLLFIEIIDKIKKIIPSIRAVMIGDGELRDKVESEIKLRNLSSTITLTGFLKDPLKTLKRAKILVMTSQWEGFGLSAIEALSIGVPVICTKVGGLPDIVDNDCGKVCDNSEDMIDTILGLLNNESSIERASLEAQKKAEKLNNYDSYMNNIKRIYKAICKTK